MLIATRLNTAAMQVMIELAEAINSKPLPPVSQRHGLLLPPDEDALLAQNTQLHVRPGRLSDASASAQQGATTLSHPEVLPLGATSRGAVLPRPAKHEAFTVKQTSPARALGQPGADWEEEGPDESMQEQEEAPQEDAEMTDAGPAPPEEDDLAKELEAGLEDEEWM